MHLVANTPSIDGTSQPLTRRRPILLNQGSLTMGKKKPPHQWTVHLESVYRRDRDERIAKVFALVLPIITSKPAPKIVQEEKENESTKTYRHLRTRLQ
jgi:hypothetical protein